MTAYLRDRIREAGLQTCVIDIGILAEPVGLEPDISHREVASAAGKLGSVTPNSPPPHSWAAMPDSDVAMWTIRMQAGAHFTLPPANPGTNRTLYFFQGGKILIGGREIDARSGLTLRPELAAAIENGSLDSEFLLLQGRPIGEPIASYGPFVMNTRAEIVTAVDDFQAGKLGEIPPEDLAEPKAYR